MSLTGFYLRERLCAAMVTALSVEPAGRELDDVIPILVYRGPDGVRSVEIGPTSQTPTEEVTMILQQLSDEIKGAR